MGKRAEALVAAWNRADLDGTLALYADDVVVVSTHPKRAPDVSFVEVRGKAALREAMLQVSSGVPRFELLSAVETGDHLSLLLKDADRRQLTVAIDLDEAGLIKKLVSLRAP